MDIEQTSAHLKEHWVRIETQLLGGNYRPGAVKAVEIPKPNGGVRTLGIPNVQDRLIEQAIHYVMNQALKNRTLRRYGAKSP